MFSGFAWFVYNSLTIKSTKKIWNWTAVTVGSEYIQLLIIHNHAHCLLCTGSFIWGTARWWSDSHFLQVVIFKIQNTVKIWQRFQRQMKAGLVFVKWLTLGPRVVSLRFYSLVTPLTQVTDWQLRCSGYKSLISDIGILATSCCSATLGTKGLNAIWESLLKVNSRREIPSVKLSFLVFWSDALPIIEHYGSHSIVILLHLMALELGVFYFIFK